MNIAIGQIVHETNTFSPNLATEKEFAEWEWLRGPEITKRHLNVRDYLGGMIDEANKLNINKVPTFSAFTRPAGKIEHNTYQEIKKHFIESLESIDKLDGICFNLHGAGVAEGVQDIEGDLLQMARNLVGPSIPIVVTLDLHANITHKMVSHADALLNVKEYPHIDSYEVGVKAMNLIYKMIDNKLKPQMAFHKLPLMAPLTSSYLSPVKNINNFCKDIESNPDVIDCSFVHGFPYADISEGGSSIIVITKNSTDLAVETAEKVANFVMNKKDSFFPKMLTPIEGVKKALDIDGGPIIINETSDNPGGGSTGDSTYLLQAMIEAKATNSCLGTIFDSDVVEKVMGAGVGQNIDVELGGKEHSGFGKPLKVTAYIKSITDGRFTQSSPMWRGMRVDMGHSVRLIVHGIDVIVCSKRSQVFDDQVFKLHGINVKTYKLVGVKSSNHFRAHFEKVGKKIITVNAPGLSRFDFKEFKYSYASHTNYPLSLKK